MIIGSMGRRGNCHDNVLAENYPVIEVRANSTTNLRYKRCS